KTGKKFERRPGTIRLLGIINEEFFVFNSSSSRSEKPLAYLFLLSATSKFLSCDQRPRTESQACAGGRFPPTASFRRPGTQTSTPSLRLCPAWLSCAADCSSDSNGRARLNLRRRCRG